MGRYSFKILLLVLTIASCSEPQTLSGPTRVSSESELTNYQSEELQGIDLELAQEKLIGVHDMLLRSDTLILCRPYGQPYYFDAFQISDNKHLASFIKEGDGPGEYIGIVLSSLSGSRQGLLGLIQRGYGGEFKEYSLSEIITDPSSEPVNQVSFQGLIGFMALQRISQNRLVSLSFRSEKLLTVLGTDGVKIDETLDYPFEEEMSHLSRNALSLAFQSLLVNNGKGKVGVFNMTSPNWGIVEVQDSEISLVSYTNLRPPGVVDQSTNKDRESINSIAFLDSNKDGFIDVCSSENFIYALYSGKSYKKHGANAGFANDLFVFNWEGELVKRLKLDKETKVIEVDDDKHLFTFIEESDRNSVRKYQLPPL